MKKKLVWVGILAAFALITGCNPSSGSPSGDSSYARYLYMTDTMSGKVYTYDPVSRSVSETNIATVGQNATGELVFYQGIGYACVGYGTKAGVYYFDPSAANPSFAKIPGTICAQYCAFASGSKAYVSVYDYSGNTDGIYSFNPSLPESGLSSTALNGTSGDSYQEVIIAPDGYLYAANYTDGTVVKIDTANDSIVATITATKGGTTGLFAGKYNGYDGVFVANTGGYDPSTYNPMPGSIDFIACNETTAMMVVDKLPGGGAIYPARLVQLSNGNLVATGYGHSYLVELSGSGPAISELSYSEMSFGSLDIAYKDGLVYIPVPDYVGDSDCLYVFDVNGVQASYSPIYGIMGTGDAVANIAFYED